MSLWFDPLTACNLRATRQKFRVQNEGNQPNFSIELMSNFQKYSEWTCAALQPHVKQLLASHACKFRLFANAASQQKTDSSVFI